MREWEWLFLDAASTGLWRIGQPVLAGDLLGITVSGQPVRSSVSGSVASIQFDIERCELILAVRPEVGVFPTA
jgi:hypothetical protein